MAIEDTSQQNTGWVSSESEYALDLLKRAQDTNRSVVLLLGAGMSADAGIPLAGQLSEYLVQVAALVRAKGFSSVRQYIEETRWPSRHDLRIALMLELKLSSLKATAGISERLITQAALVSELRRASPTMAFSLDDIFSQLRPGWHQKAAKRDYRGIRSVAENLAKKIPRSVAYRSLLFHMCENDQTMIDACLDHFIRDRSPTTTHQLIVYLSQQLRSRLIFSTNFDSLVERAFQQEGVPPTVYEIQGTGTIPSPQLLLSQHLSVVKLHGGAHQMRTGFDLDDPLPTSALASFYEVFDRLKTVSGETPLLVVMGYGGADRRVMDIVTAHIKRWSEQRKAGPCVLWINRDEWEPLLLESAVTTHPNVLFGLRGTAKRDEPPGKTHDRFPAHVLRYREGRLFLLEAYQHLARSFPIARTFYQSVNFVPHSTPRAPNAKAAKELERSEWRFAVIAAEVGGGSSSQLAALAEKLDLSGYRVIWVDMAEVPGVSALLDVISEHLSKYDFRLHPFQRPVLLDGMYDWSKGREEITELEKADIALAARWLQNALRRGRYVLALDSVDEFPGTHPALDGISGDMSAWRRKRHRLLVELLLTIVKDSDGFGESRIAIATTIVNKYSGKSAKVENPYFNLQEFARTSHSPGVGAPGTQGIKWIPLPGASYLTGAASGGDLKTDVDSQAASNAVPAANTVAGDTTAIGANPAAPADAPATAAHVTDAPTPVRTPIALAARDDTAEALFNGWNEILRKDPVPALIIAVATCARRIRSEVLLTECTGALLADIRRSRNKTDLANDSQSDDSKVDCNVEFHFFKNWESTVTAPGIQSADSIGTCDEKNYNKIVNLIREIAGTKRVKDSTLCPIAHLRGARADKSEVYGQGPPRWFYRLEGGYHWMHATIRNKLYERLLANYPRLIAFAHFYISRMCYEHLYDRSRDARAFLEYVFHRTAAIRRLVEPDQPGVSNNRDRMPTNPGLPMQWLRRLAMAIHREKPTLMTRGRLPSLVYQFRQLQQVIMERVEPAIERNSNAEDIEALKVEVKDLQAELLGVEAEVLLAGGHPHTAARRLWERILVLSDKTFSEGSGLTGLNIPASELLDADSKPAGMLREALQAVKLTKDDGGRPLLLMRALCDFAYAIQSPLMSGTYPDNEKRPRGKEDWIIEANKETAAANEQNLPDSLKLGRARRFALCDEVYKALEAGAAGLLAYKPTSAGGDPLELPIEQEAPYLDFAGGLRRRRLELDLLEHSDGMVRTAGLYQQDKYGPKSAFVPAPKTETSDKIAEEYGRPLPRISRRRRRHECYRKCLFARRLAQVDIEGKWERIERLLLDAEAVLAREGDPANRQALGIARLTYADLCLQRAELIRWKKLFADAEEDRELAARGEKVIPRLRKATDKRDWSKYYERADQLLTLVEPIFTEGRTENAWRLYHLLTRARRFMFNAQILVADAPVKAQDELYWAAKHLVSAFTNCGLWNDRQWILLTWWDAMRSFIYAIIDDETQASEHWKRLKAQLGIKWDANWNMPAGLPPAQALPATTS